MTVTGLRAGVGRAVITAPVGMPMGGWSNAVHDRSEGNDLDLLATALVVADGETAAVVCELDLCLLTMAQSDAIRQAVSVSTGIDPAAVRVTATHSHSAPVTGELTGSGWMRDGLDLIDPYMAMVTAQVAGAAREAQLGLRSVQVGHGRGSSPLAVNRRVDLPGGGIRVGHAWDRPVDHTLRIGRLDTPAGDAVATIVHYSAHPTIVAGGNRHIHAEYPGPLRRVVESAVGGRCLFLQGTPGDIGPVETFVDDLEPYHRLGSMIGHDAASAATRSSARPHRQRVAESQDPSTWLAFYEYEPMPPNDTTLRVSRRIVDAPVRREGVGDAGAWRAEQANLRGRLLSAIDRGADPFEIRELRVQTKGASMRAERAEALAGRVTFPLEIHGLRIGPLALIGVPVEPFLGLGLAIEDRSPFPMTMVSGYTNGYRNYLPTIDEWERGGYEVDSCSFEPEVANLFVETAVDLLRELAE